MATTFQLRLVGSSIATTSTNVDMGCIWSATVLGGVPLALGALFQTIRTGLLGGVVRRVVRRLPRPYNPPSRGPRRGHHGAADRTYL
jgi:hypothetical protein